MDEANEPNINESQATAVVQVPRDIGELMVRPDALQVLERQVRILGSMRRASIAMTFPEDWLLFRAEDPRTASVSQYGYLQDKGCQRIRDLWGIDTRNIGPMDEKGLPGLRVDAGDGSFSIVMIGDGYCYKTGQTVERIEGGRSSKDDAVTKFIQAEERAGRKVTEAQLDLTVRKNARANLEGNIVRRLTGMSGVTIEELADCWKGSGRDVAQCILGRGYGQGQRPTPRAKTDGQQETPSGESRATYEADVPPTCESCNVRMTLGLVPAGKKANGQRYPAFFSWSCPNWKKCKTKGVAAKGWHENPASRPPSPAGGETALDAQQEPGWDG